MNCDRIISALIGLVGACNNNPKTENTDRVLIKAFAFYSCFPGCGDDAVMEMISEIRAEKNAVAPGCAICASPCGNTSDYDMERIYSAGDDIRKIKLCILSELGEAAALLCRVGKTEALTEDVIEFFYKALSYVSYDMSEDELDALLCEVRKIKQKIERSIKK